MRGTGCERPFRTGKRVSGEGTVDLPPRSHSLWTVASKRSSTSSPSTPDSIRSLAFVGGHSLPICASDWESQPVVETSESITGLRISASLRPEWTGASSTIVTSLPRSLLSGPVCTGRCEARIDWLHLPFRKRTISTSPFRGTFACGGPRTEFKRNTTSVPPSDRRTCTRSFR